MTDRRTILIRYDEIGLKGKNRRYFVNCLVHNIKRALKGMESLEIQAPHGRVFVKTSASQVDECLRRLRFVPGIASISVGFSLAPDMDRLADLGSRLIEPRLAANPRLKFCVRTRRSEKRFPKTSTEVDQEVGARILKALADKGLTVNIKEADFVLEIEIGERETVVFDNRIPGLRGLPVGSSGTVLCLLSGGIDSPVAAYKMMRRGCRVHMIFFDNRPFLGRGGHDKVVRLAQRLNRYQGGGRLFVIPFQDMQVAIRDSATPRNRVVLYRRMMYRIAAAVAQERRCLGLVTGESLGQVASQTLENLAAVSQVVGGSVFRPLIGMDKQEIIDQARAIDTYTVSVEPQPDCCSIFMPQHPATRTDPRELEQDETLFPWQKVLREAVERCEARDLDAVE